MLMRRGPGRVSQEFHREEGHADFIIRCQQLAPPRIRALMRAEEEFLLALPEAADSFLDVGCGSGRILEALAGYSRRLAGIDLVSANLLYSRRRVARPDLLLVRCDALSMPFLDRRFSAVGVMINTLGNFGDGQLALLREMRRVGGKVIAGCYSLEAEDTQREWYALLQAEGLLGPEDTTRSDRFHFVSRDGYVSERFDEGRLGGLLRAAGMRVEILRPIPELLIGREL